MELWLFHHYFSPLFTITNAAPCSEPGEITHKRFSGENTSPFVRAHVPQLEREHQISPHELIVFIDGLNEAFLANPALRVANTAANVGGLAPSMIMQMVSVGVNVAAGIGSPVTTKVRTKNYLAKANEELFHPRGLDVRICKTGKMLEAAGSGGEAFRHAQQRMPVADPMGGAWDRNSNPIMQRMSALGDGVMALSFDGVEEAVMPDRFWKKWGAKEARKAEQNQNEKMMKEQARQDRRAGRRPSRR